MKSSRWLLTIGTLIGPVLLAVVLSLTFRASTPAQAQGTTITVNTDQDEWTGSCAYTCSLREAIVLANNTAGTDPVTITFAGDYVITLTRASGGVVQPLPSITRTAVHIIGDRNGDGTPDVVINGEHLTQIGAMGLWIRADHALVDGLEIRNVDCTGCWGLDIHGNNATIRNSRFVSNTTGILLTNGASGNLITGCLVAWNRDDGILVSSRFVTQPTTVITPAHHNTIAYSFILSNSNKGIIIQRGAHDNVVQGNLIAGNGCFGLHLRGGAGTSTDPFVPPTGNQILENEIRGNGAGCSPQAGVVNDRTHQPPGDIPTPSGGYDNLFAGNVITANTGIGIYNIGASPLITGNTIANNTSYGIYNVPDFGSTYSPAQANDDILSIPILKNNTAYGNRTYAIYSLDTAPVDRYTLHTDNVLSQTGGLRVLQVWYGAVEVVTGTVTAPVPISSGISARIVASGTGWLRDLVSYTSASGYSSGIWGDSGIQYADIRSWVGIREFEVASDGTLVRHLTHTVQVYLQGVYTGAVRFSWDGLTATDPISGDVLIPQWVQTGPYGRYQVAEVNFTYDTDRDSLPDVVESTGDTDNDGQPDYLDTDSDNDGIPDSVEGGGDVDGDGMPDYLDPDSDGDGIPDWVEAGCESQPTGGETCPNADRDTDGDGMPDYLDPDSDGDGIPDWVEAGCESQPTGNEICPDVGQDTDGDDMPDYLDPDADGDGIPDWMEAGCQSPPSGNTVCPDVGRDSDNDRTPDYLDDDSDNDGVPDWMEAGCTEPPANNQICPEAGRDSDGDGRPDYRDDDDDGDGILTMYEYIAGTDYFCTDTTLDTDRDGTPNCRDNDVDGDRIPNYLDTDSDGDGTPDGQENYPRPNPPPFGHGDVPAWIDPMYRLYLPIVLRNR